MGSHKATLRRSRFVHAVMLSAVKPVIGGQAVIEGVMMRSPKSFAIAVRTPDGSIAVREEAWLSFAERWPVLKLPILRGANMLVESMVNGIQALTFSAATAFPDDVEAQKAQADVTAKKAQGDLSGGMGVMLVATLALAFLIFKGVPHFTALGIGQLLGHDGTSALPMTSPLFHAVDGGVKLVVFIAYLALLGRTADAKRLFTYHGAEHKSVHVWEANEPLDVAHALPKTTAHPRCGTSLLLLVITTSAVVFAAVLPFAPVVSEHSVVQALFLLVLKLPLLLPIAGVAYELQRLAARYPTNPVVRAFIAPGMLLQRLTTREPGPAELEVALAALRKTVWREEHSAEMVPWRGAASVEVYPDFAAVAARVA